MDRLAVVLVLTALAIVVAQWFRRRQLPAPPTQSHYRVPAQLDRADFAGADRPWLVVVFSSTVCATCAEASAKAAVLACDDVAVDDVSYQARPELHKRYDIDAAPTTVIADREGVVCAAFVGAPSATDLWAAMAEARAPGSSPEPGLGSAPPR